MMAHQAPLKYTFYIAATPEKVWEGFVSRESNRIIFSGAELQADFKPGGLLAWVGAGPDGKPMTYVRGKVLRFEPPRVFQYTFAMGQNDKASRATIELVPETDRKSTRLNSSHQIISYAVFCLKKKKHPQTAGNNANHEVPLGTSVQHSVADLLHQAYAVIRIYNLFADFVIHNACCPPCHLRL